MLYLHNNNQRNFERSPVDARWVDQWIDYRESKSFFLLGNVTIKTVDARDELQDASALLNRKYAERGYGDGHRIKSGSSYQTFIASSDGAVVGTATLNIDSEKGMAADDRFRDELNIFRGRPNVKACELTKLAFEAEVPSKPVLAALFFAVFQFNRLHHGCTDLFIEVNPRHCRFYQALLGLQKCADLKMNETVCAPSQLMHITASDVQAQIEEHAGKASSGVRSLYALFPAASATTPALH